MQTKLFTQILQKPNRLLNCDEILFVGTSIPFRRHCYEVVDQPKSFSDARADCQQRSSDGGRLVMTFDFHLILVLISLDWLF
jgi:hypothetical protein